MVWFVAQKKRSQQLFIFHCVNSQGHYLDAIFLLHSQWYSDGKGCTEISFASLWFPWGGFWVYDSLKLLQLYEQKWCQALYNILKLFPAVLEIDCFAWKVSKNGVISGPYFPVFGVNTEKIQENTDRKQLRIWTLFKHSGHQKPLGYIDKTSL